MSTLGAAQGIRQTAPIFVLVKQVLCTGKASKASKVSTWVLRKVLVERLLREQGGERQHTSAYVSIRQYTSVCDSIRQHM